MKKPFLLITGSQYYPDYGTGDWVKCFETKEEASQYAIKDAKDFDWQIIVDLREWTE
jgi:hypothetical protein